jgi:4'-phosphopantetheinyl transferase
MRHLCVHRSDLLVDEVHVWVARLPDDHHATADLLRILDQEERARAAQFSFDRDRMRFIQAHGMVRQILAGYSDEDATTLTLARNKYGKPYLIPRTNGPNLQFSVSHSGDCCVLAVRLDHAVGIDVEQLRDLPEGIDIAQRYFTPAESKLLGGLRGTARRDAFFALWTHKEAIVKGFGVSLPANLGRVEFDFDTVGSPRLIAWGGDRSVAQSWSILRLDPAPGYIGAVASVHPIRSLTSRDWNDIRAS